MGDVGDLARFVPDEHFRRNFYINETFSIISKEHAGFNHSTCYYIIDYIVAYITNICLKGIHLYFGNGIN